MKFISSHKESIIIILVLLIISVISTTYKGVESSPIQHVTSQERNPTVCDRTASMMMAIGKERDMGISMVIMLRSTQGMSYKLSHIAIPLIIYAYQHPSLTPPNLALNTLILCRESNLHSHN